MSPTVPSIGQFRVIKRTATDYFVEAYLDLSAIDIGDGPQWHQIFPHKWGDYDLFHNTASGNLEVRHDGEAIIEVDADGLRALKDVDFSGADSYTPAVEEGWPVILKAGVDFEPHSISPAGAAELITYNTASSAATSEMVGHKFPYGTGTSGDRSFLRAHFLVPKGYDGRRLRFTVWWAAENEALASPDPQTISFSIWALTSMGDGFDLDAAPTVSGAQRAMSDTYQGPKILHTMTATTSTASGIALTPGQVAMVNFRRSPDHPNDDLEAPVVVHKVVIDLAT